MILYTLYESIQIVFICMIVLKIYFNVIYIKLNTITLKYNLLYLKLHGCIIYSIGKHLFAQLY